MSIQDEARTMAEQVRWVSTARKGPFSYVELLIIADLLDRLAADLAREREERAQLHELIRVQNERVGDES